MDNNYVSAFFSIIQRGGFVSEPAILVKYNDDTSQVWSMEKLDLKLIDMRELYDELKSLDENAKALFSNLRKNSGGKMFFSKGSFTNYVGQFWVFFDHLPPFVYTFYNIKVDIFWLPTHLFLYT